MKISAFVLLFLAACTFYSCDNLTEEIHLNADGSGSYTMYSNIVPAMRKAAVEMSNMFADSLSGETVTEEEIEQQIWEDFPDEIDSTFSYADVLTEEEEAEMDGETKRISKKMVGFMEGGRKKGYLNVGAKYPFADLKDLEFAMKKLGENQMSENAGIPELDSVKSETTFSFQNSVFVRKTKFLSTIDKATLQESPLLNMYMGEGKIKTIVHLPRNVKSARGENLVKIEGKTVTFEYSMLDYIFGMVSSDFEITMED